MASTTWNTSAEPFTTKGKSKIQFKLPEFNETKVVEYEVHVTKQQGQCDMIMGRDLLDALGIDISFKEGTVTWDNMSVPMKSPDITEPESYTINESDALQKCEQRIKSILDAKYEPADLEKIVSQCKHLNDNEQEKLLSLLNKFKSLFDGQLGHWKAEDYDIELKPDAEPYHARPFPIPKIHEGTLKMEVERLCEVGVLKKVNRSEWAAPTFIIPKKDGTVRFISDFRELNKRIKRKPFPIPKIQDLMLKLEGFTYGTSLDLNMGYYHVELSPNSKKLCTIVLPWG